MDNIPIYSNNEFDYEDYIRKVLDRLRGVGL